MRRRTYVTAALCSAVLAATPMSATDFSLVGSYWDTKVAGDTAGGGIQLGMPFNEVFAIELRATYFEQLSDEPLQNAFDSNDPIFQDQGIQALPLEAGVRFSFPERTYFRPHLAGGLSYFLLDSDFGNVSDELGYYVALGATVGDGEGMDFFFEGIWREATAGIELDPEQLHDVTDLNVVDHADLDLGGLGVNVGLRFNF